MNEYLAIIEGVGGRYGFCVMCSLPADHYCKITKASLCSIECKKQHLEIAEKQYKDHFQARNLWVAIEDSFKVFLTFLEKRECVIALTVLMNLLDKPHLFMVVKPEFK